MVALFRVMKSFAILFCGNSCRLNGKLMFLLPEIPAYSGPIAITVHEESESVTFCAEIFLTAMLHPVVVTFEILTFSTLAFPSRIMSPR